MRQIREGLYQISGFPRHMINMYLAGDVLVDAGVRRDRHRILKALHGHTVNRHVLTHVHPDHQGASHAICEALDIPLWCAEREAAAMESGDFSEQIPTNLITTVQHQFWTGPAHPVARGLREGDMVGDFTVIETPGHSPGHLSFFREYDRVLIIGDAARNIDFVTLQPGLAEPPAIFTVDAVQNRASLRKLAALKPETILFGHGRPLDEGDLFLQFVENLPD